MSGVTDTRLAMLIGALQLYGRESRIRAELGPDYDPTTECARGLLHQLRRAPTRDAAHDAKNIASVMISARDEIRKLRALLETCEQQARDDERGRVLAAVADALGEVRVGRSPGVDRLLATMRAGRVPGSET